MKTGISEKNNTSKNEAGEAGSSSPGAREMISTAINLNLIKFLLKFGQMIPTLDIENDKHQKLLFDLFAVLAKKHISDMNMPDSGMDNGGENQIDYEKYAGLDHSLLEEEIGRGYEEILDGAGE
ncbi:MAG: hypothetical protein M1269_09850 [Chloroflexi bacterium]|nr:hypothetical protein [Chloroflexota bacterium]